MIWKVLYGILFSGCIAGAYLFARIFGAQGGLPLFGSGAFVIFFIHFVFWPKLTLRGFCDLKMMFRGFLFGITQVLIFKAQSHGYTTTALVTSTMGSVFGVILGRMILGERIKGIASLAILFSFAAVFVDPFMVLKSYWGILGGFIQGSGFILARSLILEKKSIRQSISMGFFMAFLVSTLALGLTGDLSLLVPTSSKNLVFLVMIAVTVQYGFFYLYTILDSQRASILTLSRIPWAAALEGGLLKISVSGHQIASAVLVIISTVLLAIDTAKKTR